MPGESDTTEGNCGRFCPGQRLAALAWPEEAGASNAHRPGLDPVLYIMYSPFMATTPRKGIQEARAQLPALLADAERGQVTIITKRSRPIAALVPIAQATAPRQRSLLTLEGTGAGLWSKDSSRRLAQLRDEWS